MSKDRGPTLIDWLWPNFEPNFTRARPLGRIIGTILALLIVILIMSIIGVVVIFVASVFQIGPYRDQTAGEAIRNLGLVLAAVFGAPFIAWRSFVAQRQTDIAEQGLITDRLNKAVQGLGAEKTVRRQRTNTAGKLLYEDRPDGETDFKKPIFDEFTVPNLEVRIGSLFALERVANESIADRAQIFEILTAYVSNNFNTPTQFPYQRLEPFSKADLEPSIDERFGSMSAGKALEWARQLKKPRPDTLAAISVIVRSIERFESDSIESFPAPLVFSGANLQQANFRAANLMGATFEDCQLDGADFEKSNLSEAQFVNCSLIGASLNSAKLVGAKFWNTSLECVNAGNIKEMYGANFWGCDCSGIMFDDADMSGSSFSGVAARKGSFRVLAMDDTRFAMCDFRDANLSAYSMRNLSIFSSMVPNTGLCLVERISMLTGSTSRVAKKVRLYFNPDLPDLVRSNNFGGALLPGEEELVQDGVELFNP